MIFPPTASFQTKHHMSAIEVIPGFLDRIQGDVYGHADLL
jgi:hypothetical protein